MNYTMDSVEHAQAVLTEKTDLEVRSLKPCFFTKLNDIDTVENRYFFGVLTIGRNVDSALLSFNDFPIIEISTNSQIIQLFQSVDFLGELANESPYYEASFRGFEIVMG
jgi:hypothetical protein